MLDRISLILRTKNISAAQFADKIDVQRSSVSHVLSGRNKPSLEFIQKILKSYPEIGPDWLLFGKGPMLLESEDLFSTPGQKIEDPPLIQRVKLEIEEKAEIVVPEIQVESAIASIDQKRGSVKGNLDATGGKSTEKSSNPSNKDTKPLVKSKRIDQSDGVDKKAEKIVIFYDDKSFSVYYPEN